jgi:hypothetical protein
MLMLTSYNITWIKKNPQIICPQKNFKKKISSKKIPPKNEVKGYEKKKAYIYPQNICSMFHQSQVNLSQQIYLTRGETKKRIIE